jgi:hypothetical protein
MSFVILLVKSSKAAEPTDGGTITSADGGTSTVGVTTTATEDGSSTGGDTSTGVTGVATGVDGRGGVKPRGVSSAADSGASTSTTGISIGGGASTRGTSTVGTAVATEHLHLSISLPFYHHFKCIKGIIFIFQKVRPYISRVVINNSKHVKSTTIRRLTRRTP